jgi:hypothetical protein
MTVKDSSMLPRMMLVIVLAIAIGFSVAKVFEQGSIPEIAAVSGSQLDVALGGDPALTSTERWYDNPSTIGVVASGVVFVVGLLVVTTAMKPKLS